MDDKQSDRIASERSFVERKIAKRAHGVHRLKSKDSSGRWARYFILVEPHRVSEFTSAIKGDGMIDLKTSDELSLQTTVKIRPGKRDN